jgi:hypothetical protein
MTLSVVWSTSIAWLTRISAGFTHSVAGIPMTERSAADVLARYADVHSVDHEGTEGHGLSPSQHQVTYIIARPYLSSSPIQSLAFVNVLDAPLDMPLQAWMDFLCSSSDRGGVRFESY